MTYFANLFCEVTYFWIDGFRNQGVTSQDVPLRNRSFFEVTLFRTNLFSKSLFYEITHSQVYLFRSDRFWNWPFFEVIDFEVTIIRTVLFRIDLLLKWPIFEKQFRSVSSNNFSPRNGSFFEVALSQRCPNSTLPFRSGLFSKSNQFQKTYFAKWLIF